MLGEPPVLLLQEAAMASGGETLLPATSLALGAGEALALRGPNGSGKTTLLRIAAGALIPSSGRVRVFGRRPDERRADFRRRVAALIAPPPLAREATLAEHLALVARSWGLGPDAAEGAAADGLAELGIGPLARRFPHELSSGQLQLFSLALLLARPAELLLLDEPEQRLDAQRRGLAAEALSRRLQAGCALLLATHSERLAAQLGARTIRLGG